MAYKRTSKTFGNTRRTQTYNSKTGNMTTSYSSKPKGGSTRTTYSTNGKTYMTTYLGNGYYEKKVISGLKPKPPKKIKVTRTKTMPWKAPKPLKSSTSRRTTRKSSYPKNVPGASYGWLVLIIIFIIMILFSQNG